MGHNLWGLVPWGPALHSLLPLGALRSEPLATGRGVLQPRAPSQCSDGGEWEAAPLGEH